MITRIERRWAVAILAACVPPRGTTPGLADAVDLDAFVLETWRRYPRAVRMGLRLLFWVIQLIPIFVVGRLRFFTCLAPADRQRCLDRLLHHRIYILREAVTLLKGVACMAYFRVPAIRAQLDPDRRSRAA